jgi:predicted nuclease with TOPRIM domain
MNNIHFSLIKVSGYRGRNFTLKMNPRGQHTIFIMDGNTGKTTTIELLRWCFKYPQSQCINNFSHTWFNHAYVLDESKNSPQHCEILIRFSAFDEKGKDHLYQFTRSVDGISDLEHKPNSDIIREVYDTLEIDQGKNVLTGNAVFDFLKDELRFKECADFFCFDGEKARELMQLSSNSEKVGDLLFLVNQRATHPRIEEYKEKLNGLKNRLLEEANAKVSDKALEILIGRLRTAIEDLRQAEKEGNSIKVEMAANSLALKSQQDRFNELENKITQAKADEIVQKLRFDDDLKTKTAEIARKRSAIYAFASQWYSADIGLINQLKTQVREKGNLPEPFRKNLISNCLTIGKCEICGRLLDESSRKHILALESVVADPDVHTFLQKTLDPRANVLDTEKEYKEIKNLIDECKRIQNQIDSIKLTKEDSQLFTERELVQKDIALIMTNNANLQSKLNERNSWIIDLKQQVTELQSKNSTLKENKVIIDRIDESISKVEAAGETIKSKTIDIISGVISEGVSSILGPKFSAKLSVKEGLVLGEDGHYGRERGGYSGRLILSYCFAEAMTLIDPIIVDTPSGNVGSHREKLARHLVANHQQIILLCLPTEINDFGPFISSNPIKIVNEEGVTNEA